MFMHLRTALCLLVLGYPLAGHAEFSILGAAGPAELAPPELQRSRATSPVPFPTANGFGSQVPLAFATRQIVPPGVAVRFGLGADPTLLVDWKGGAPWDKVLRASVRPAGLRVIVTWHAVQIRK